MLQKSTKKWTALWVSLLMAGSLSLQASSAQFLLSDQLLPNQQSGMRSVICPITVEKGKTTAFSAEYFEARLGLDFGDVDTIKITALPQQNKGRLVLDGVEVSLYDVLLRSELDRLCYVPATSGDAGWFSFVPMCSQNICATVQLNTSPVRNVVPTLKNSLSNTAKTVSVQSALNVYDANGDDMTIHLTSRPQKGKVTIDGASYTYQPFPNSSGKDSFSIVAADSRGGISKEAIVTVQISAEEPSVRFCDMKDNPSEYAAIKLYENGILTGEKTGDSVRFYPDREMTNGEFLVTLLQAASLTPKNTACVSTKLANDSEIPFWMKPYVETAINHGILESGQTFSPNQTPTRAQAVYMVNRLGAVEAVSLFNLKFNDLYQIPNWAVASYMTLGANEMLGLHENSAKPMEPLTRAVAADLLFPVLEIM